MAETITLLRIFFLVPFSVYAAVIVIAVILNRLNHEEDVITNLSYFFPHKKTHYQSKFWNINWDQKI